MKFTNKELQIMDMANGAKYDVLSMQFNRGEIDKLISANMLRNDNGIIRWTDSAVFSMQPIQMSEGSQYNGNEMLLS